MFHASQIDGLPTLEEAYGAGESLPEAVWDAAARLEALLARSGATIEHRGAGAYYQPGEDRIVLPPRGRFPSASSAGRCGRSSGVATMRGSWGV